MLPFGATGEAQDGPTGVHVPIGCAQASESRHQVYSAVIADFLGVVLRVAALGEEPHFIPQPLDHRAAYEDAALQGVLHLSVQADGDSG